MDGAAILQEANYIEDTATTQSLTLINLNSLCINPTALVCKIALCVNKKPKMKHTILALSSLFVATFCSAQVQSGKVTYDETIKLDIQLDDNNAAFRDMLPKEQHITQVLYFTPDAALYTAEKKEAKPDAAADDDGRRMVIKMDVPEHIVYTDLKEKKITEMRELMTRKFLISSETGKASWKMTGQQKTILEYPCQQAVWINDKDTITAWFTAAIPVPVGPQGWNGLPGLILEADQNGQFILKATKVEPGPIDKTVLVKPTDGKKVTREEYKAIEEKKRKEMQEQYGGKGNVIIKVDQRH